eukprot:CAMPEP_0197588032 /NCGR_PEP_ID=MMETSP1326-20131121/9460_1 /TAXON_ID=1155430 /ORGANISM="Genus nov. species nov., Strain RCC2288" /LENGTH=54 /DNA_ID=CAMNT_0043152819 /DNA_START=15 /DNA_END=176 /DNA_ORIENTATION=-
MRRVMPGVEGGGEGAVLDAKHDALGAIQGGGVGLGMEEVVLPEGEGTSQLHASH